MLKPLIDSAIEAALRQEWQKAIDINLKILEQSPYHSPTLNRLAKAYQHCGQIDNAIKTYEQALEFNRFNDIARKNLLKLKKQTGSPVSNGIGGIIDCDFVEEPGKTKTVSLLRLGPADLLSGLQPGQVVKLQLKGHFIMVESEAGEHIGVLPDDLCFTLRDLIKAGNEYHTVIRSVQPREVKVFIKETKRSDGYRFNPSFS